MKKVIIALLGIIVVGIGVAVFLDVMDLGPMVRTAHLPRIDYTQTFEQEEEAYFVYFWQESCPACTEFEPAILEAFNDYEVPIYVVDMSDGANSSAWGEGQLDGVSHYSDINVEGTPMLMLVRDGEVARHSLGVLGGEALLNELK